MVKPDIGNAQTIGTMEYQNDYFATATKGKETLAIVCDGSTTDRSGKTPAVIAVDVFLNQFKNKKENTEPYTYFNQAIQKANKQIADNTYLTKRSQTTLLAVLIRKQKIHWVSIGNSTLHILYKEQLYHINNKTTKQITMGENTLHKTCVLIIATDGITNHLNEIEIIKTLNERKTAYEKSQDLIKVLNQKKLKQQDNGTLITIQKF